MQKEEQCPQLQRASSSLLVSFFNQLRQSLVAKLIILGFIVLILLFPYFLTKSLVGERKYRACAAEEEVSEKWGGKQTISAPILTIPLQREIHSKEGSKFLTSTLFILPELLNIETSVIPEIRTRSIYQIMLYKSQSSLKAELRWPTQELLGVWNIDTSKDAKLLFKISDVKGIEQFAIQVNGQAASPLAGEVIAIPLKHNAIQPGEMLQVTGDIHLNGCRQLLFNPIGKKFILKMSSPWAHPSFTGGFLPKTREINDQGFTAHWEVSELNSSFAPYYFETTQSKRNIYTSDKALGVSLVQPAGTYQQVERVSSYAFLIISIVLIAFLIGERVTHIKIHPLQYFFAGLSLIMFYVLLLALAEHISFNLSYAIATLVIAGMTTLYCRMIFSRKKSAALLLGGIMVLVYLLIFVLTRLEDYALLAGSAILLVLLGILMKVTGHLNATEDAEQQKTLP